MHEFIRLDVQADASAGTRLVGMMARRRAELLFREIERRGLFCKPIDWPGADKCAATAGLQKKI